MNSAKFPEYYKVDLILYVKENYLTYLISEKAIDEVIAILNLLFPDNSMFDTRKKTIRKKYYFDSYFDIKLPIISYEKFKEIKKKDGKGLIKEFLTFSVAKQNAFTFLLNEYRNDFDKENFVMFSTNAVCCFQSNQFLFDNHMVVKDILDYSTTNKNAEQQVIDIIEGCVPSVPILLIIKYLLLNDDFSYDKRKLKEIYLSKLKLYLTTLDNSEIVIDNKQRVIKNIIDSFSKLDKGDNPDEILIPEALEPVKDFASHRVEDHLSLFFNRIDESSSISTLSKINSYSSLLWGSDKGVNDFLQSLPDKGQPKLVKLKEFTQDYIDGGNEPIPLKF